MSFDFPNSPALNQVVQNPTSGGAWQWDGVKWGPVQAGGWVDAPADGNTYGRKNNAWNSVDAMVAPALNDTGRNLLHNPLFSIWQRGAGNFTTSGSLTADRWKMGFNTDTYTVGQTTISDGQRAQIGDEAAELCPVINVTGNSAAAAYSILWQPIEDVRRLGNKTITVSFWAWCGSGALKMGVSWDQYFGTGGSPSTTVNGSGQAVTLSTTATRYSLTYTLPSTSGKTLGTNNDHATFLEFWFSSGSTQATRAGNIGVQSGAFAIWGTQLEIGTVMSPLAKRDPADELAICQRFYQVGQLILQCYQAAGAVIYFSSLLPVTMRAAPVLTVASTAQTNCSGLTIGSYVGMAVWMQATTTAAGSVLQAASFTASADL